MARRWDLVGLAAVVVGAGLRLLIGLVLHPPFKFVYSDMGGYVDRAKRLAEGAPANRIDAFFPPGAHMILAVPFFIFGTGRAGLWAGAALWSGLSAVAPFLMWRIARRLLSPAAAGVTAVLVSLWPIQAAYTGFFVSEIPALTFLLLTLWLFLAAKDDAGWRLVVWGVLGGLAAGITLGVRPQLSLNVIIGLVPLVLGWRSRLNWWLGAAVGISLPLSFVLLVNARVAGAPTGLSQNDGLGMFLGQCPAHSVTAGTPATGYYSFGSPVAAQLHRGRDYTFTGHQVWDQGFFYRQALKCISDDGLGHVGHELQNVDDLLATSQPWPLSNERIIRWFVVPANDALGLSIVAIVIGAAVVVRRRRERWRSGEAVLLAHLLAVIPTALLYLGDPRFRSPYDFFALALSAAIVTDRRLES